MIELMTRYDVGSPYPSKRPVDISRDDDAMARKDPDETTTYTTIGCPGLSFGIPL